MHVAKSNIDNADVERSYSIISIIHIVSVVHNMRIWKGTNSSPVAMEMLKVTSSAWIWAKIVDDADIIDDFRSLNFAF